MSDPAADASGLLAQLGRPRRRAVPRVSEWLLDGDHAMVPALDNAIAAWRLGEGPAVLLVHGWEDDTSLWTPLIASLRARGRAVVALDLPGHGHSEGDRCDIALAAGAIEAVAGHLGPISAAAGHSFGGPALAAALARGTLRPDCVALIAPPVEQARQFERAARRHGVDEALVEAALAAGDAEGRWFDLVSVAAGLEVDALFIHGLEDDQCPPEPARRAAAVWRGARFMDFEGLGHRDVAQDPEVIATLTAWLDG